MPRNFAVETHRKSNHQSGPRTLASGSRRAQQDAKRAAAKVIPRSVLFVMFLAASLATIWLLLNDYPAAGIATCIAAVGTLVWDARRSKYKGTAAYAVSLSR